MSVAQEIVTILNRHGVRLEADGDRLRFHPREALTPEALEVVRRHKSEIITFLANNREQALEANSQTSANLSIDGEIVPDSDIFDPIEFDCCGGIDAWWDAYDRQRCVKCDPPNYRLN